MRWNIHVYFSNKQNQSLEIEMKLFRETCHWALAGTVSSLHFNPVVLRMHRVFVHSEYNLITMNKYFRILRIMYCGSRCNKTIKGRYLAKRKSTRDVFLALHTLFDHICILTQYHSFKGMGIMKRHRPQMNEQMNGRTETLQLYHTFRKRSQRLNPNSNTNFQRNLDGLFILK